MISKATIARYKNIWETSIFAWFTDQQAGFWMYTWIIYFLREFCKWHPFESVLNSLQRNHWSRFTGLSYTKGEAGKQSPSGIPTTQFSYAARATKGILYADARGTTMAGEPSQGLASFHAGERGTTNARGPSPWAWIHVAKHSQWPSRQCPCYWYIR